MQNQSTCPECGTVWINGVTCEGHFHQLLYRENEDPNRGAVHHLMVLAYHLQHPSQYSAEGLAYGIQLLVDFVEHQASPQQVRQNHRLAVDSHQRKWNIRAKPGAQAAYKHPVSWKMTVKDVVDAGADHYVESVQAWVRSIIADLRSTGNFW